MELERRGGWWWGVVPTGGEWSAPEKRKEEEKEGCDKEEGAVHEATGAEGDSMVSKPRRVCVSEGGKRGSYQS